MTTSNFLKYIPQFRFEINVTTVITVVLLLVSWAYNYGEMKAERAQFQTKAASLEVHSQLQSRIETLEVKETNLVSEVHAHFASDAEKFGSLASKESRAVRDKEVDNMLHLILDQLKENNRRLVELERMHMRDK